MSKMDRSSKQSIIKDIAALNNTLDQMDLTDIYRNFIQEKQNTHSFKCTWNIFRHHMIGHKTSLKKFKKIEIILSIFSDHKGLKLKTNLKEKTQKHSNSWRLNSVLLNNEWFNNEIKEEIKKFLETNENEHTRVQNLWATAKAVLRGKLIAILAFLKKDKYFK